MTNTLFQKINIFLLNGMGGKGGGGWWGLIKLDLSQFYQQLLLSSSFLSFVLVVIDWRSETKGSKFKSDC